MSYNPYAAIKNWFKPINELLIEMLNDEDNWKQWRKEWSLSSEGIFNPINPLSTAKGEGNLVHFSGNNKIILAFWSALAGDNHLWSTAAQIKKAGFEVKQSAYESKVFRAVLYPKIVEDKETGKSRLSGFNMYTVLNLNEDNITATSTAQLSVKELVEKYSPKPKKKVTLNTKLKKTDKYIKEYLSISKVTTGYGNPAYVPMFDKILMPVVEDFTTPQAYYSTYLHEIGHSTGHTDRLNRLVPTSFGSKDYAFEELVAELFSIYMSNMFGIEYDLENHVSYLADWQQGLKEQAGFFARASGKAMEATKYFLDLAEVEDILPKTRKVKIPAGN